MPWQGAHSNSCQDAGCVMQPWATSEAFDAVSTGHPVSLWQCWQVRLLGAGLLILLLPAPPK